MSKGTEQVVQEGRQVARQCLSRRRPSTAPSERRPSKGHESTSEPQLSDAATEPGDGKVGAKKAVHHLIPPPTLVLMDETMLPILITKPWAEQDDSRRRALKRERGHGYGPRPRSAAPRSSPSAPPATATDSQADTPISNWLRPTSASAMRTHKAAGGVRVVAEGPGPGNYDLSLKAHMRAPLMKPRATGRQPRVRATQVQPDIEEGGDRMMAWHTPGLGPFARGDRGLLSVETTSTHKDAVAGITTTVHYVYSPHNRQDRHGDTRRRPSTAGGRLYSAGAALRKETSMHTSKKPQKHTAAAAPSEFETVGSDGLTLRQKISALIDTHGAADPPGHGRSRAD